MNSRKLKAILFQTKLPKATEIPSSTKRNTTLEYHIPQYKKQMKTIGNNKHSMKMENFLYTTTFPNLFHTESFKKPKGTTLHTVFKRGDGSFHVNGGNTY